MGEDIIRLQHKYNKYFDKFKHLEHGEHLDNFYSEVGHFGQRDQYVKSYSIWTFGKLGLLRIGRERRSKKEQEMVRIKVMNGLAIRGLLLKSVVKSLKQNSSIKTSLD